MNLRGFGFAGVVFILRQLLKFVTTIFKWIFIVL